MICRDLLVAGAAVRRQACGMERWRVGGLVELAAAIHAAGLQSFVVRRALQRLERGEVSPSDAIRRIRQEATFRTPSFAVFFPHRAFAAREAMGMTGPKK